MRYDEIMEAAQAKRVTIMVYGSFTEPTTGKNFIFVRMPAGRVLWSRKIVPAIGKIINQWFTPEQHDQDRSARERGRERVCYWQSEGDLDPNNSMWSLKQPVARYEWNGESLVAVDYQPPP